MTMMTMQEIWLYPISLTLHQKIVLCSPILVFKFCLNKHGNYLFSSHSNVICLSHNHLLNISSSVLLYFIFDGWGIISARYACVQGLRLALWSRITPGTAQSLIRLWWDMGMMCFYSMNESMVPLVVMTVNENQGH